MKAPALGAVIAGGRGAVERTLAPTPIELTQVSARQGHPHHALGVDVGAAHAETGRGYIVDFAQASTRVEANEGTGEAEGHRSPNAAIGRVRHDGVQADRQSPVARGIRRL